MPDNEIIKPQESNLSSRKEDLELKELVPQETLVNMVKDVLDDLDLVKKESLEGFHLFKDLLANEGEGSSATKEQMGAMLQIYLSSIDTRLKAMDLFMKSKRASQPKVSGPATNINIQSGLTRREMLEEIDKVVGSKRAEIEVVNPNPPEKD